MAGKGVIGGTWREIRVPIDDDEEEVPQTGSVGVGMRAKRLYKTVENKQYPLAKLMKKKSEPDIPEDETHRWTEK